MHVFDIPSTSNTELVLMDEFLMAAKECYASSFLSTQNQQLDSFTMPFGLFELFLLPIQHLYVLYFWYLPHKSKVIYYNLQHIFLEFG